MEQRKPFADDRLVNGCIYCGAGEETRDHVPSRVFLDEPFPENLPVVFACSSCNHGFSADEEYVACLIESAIDGSTNPTRIRRTKISTILRRSPALRSRIEASKRSQGGNEWFEPEQARMKNVILKLARGHAAFELETLCPDDPTSFKCMPLLSMTVAEQESFDEAHYPHLFGEVGSRGMQRTLVVQAALQSADGSVSNIGFLINDWVEVQEGNYRYLAIDDDHGISVKIVIREYLACEVKWEYT